MPDSGYPQIKSSPSSITPSVTRHLPANMRTPAGQRDSEKGEDYKNLSTGALRIDNRRRGAGKLLSPSRHG
ncbi:hypothetical protein V499_05836 [Pseudogymnoascus sp. VKM F-103]|nr:hypothetical protein V499_05836 [Pseudogymnoascus sp. VKM F-103]